VVYTLFLLPPHFTLFMPSATSHLLPHRISQVRRAKGSLRACYPAQPYPSLPLLSLRFTHHCIFISSLSSC
jgi:hypothetical protein